MASGDIILKNQTSGVSRKGYLVKSVRDGFNYAQAGDTPIGVIVDSVPQGRECSIRTSGDTIAYMSHEVSAGDELRMHTATEGGRAGAIRNVGTETSYTSIGRALGKGKGLVRIALNITASASGTGGGGGSATDHTLLANIGVNAHTVIDAHLADDTTNPHGISVLGGTAITENVVGTTTTVNLDLSELLEDDGTKISPSVVKLSHFVNDLGWTANEGIVISVGGAAPIHSSGGTTPVISFQGGWPTMGGALLGTDFLIVQDFTADTTFQKEVQYVQLSAFDNDEDWASGTVKTVVGGLAITTTSDPINPIVNLDLSELLADDGTVFDAGMSGNTTYLAFTAGSDPGDKISPSVVKLSHLMYLPQHHCILREALIQTSHSMQTE